MPSSLIQMVTTVQADLNLEIMNSLQHLIRETTDLDTL